MMIMCPVPLDFKRETVFAKHLSRAGRLARWLLMAVYMGLFAAHRIPALALASEGSCSRTKAHHFQA